MIFIILAALVLLVSIVMLVQKFVLKGRMERGLGRKVEDHELTSINAWMDTSTQTNPTQPAPSPSNAQVTPKQKSPGKIALILGLLSIAVLLGLLGLSHVVQEELYFWTGCIAATVLMLPGLLLVWMASKKTKRNPGLYIETGLPKISLGVNLLSGFLAITLMSTLFILPERYYLWFSMGYPFPPSSVYAQQVGDYPLAYIHYRRSYGFEDNRCKRFEGAYRKSDHYVSLDFYDCDSADAAREKMEERKREDEQSKHAKSVQSSPGRAVSIFPKSKSGTFETNIYLLDGNHLTMLGSDDAGMSLDFESKLTGKPVIALSPADYPSTAPLPGQANSQASPNAAASETPPTETDLSLRKAVTSMMDIYFSQRGMKSESTLSGKNKSTIIVKVNPVRDESEANQIFRDLNAKLGESFKSTGIRKVQITSAQGSWSFDV